MRLDDSRESASILGLPTTIAASVTVTIIIIIIHPQLS